MNQHPIPHPERVIGVDITFKNAREHKDPDEFLELLRAANKQCVFVLEGTRLDPDPATFLGKGKCQELKEMLLLHEAQAVWCNHDLSPAQERNLERLIQHPVYSRTTLILHLFAMRAQTHEGQLQVRLACLQYESTRLVRRWTHLERQKGGIGLRGGPGETQLEADKRQLRERIKSIQNELEQVVVRRSNARRARTQQALPSVALVGYTNAGKSTLFNALTGAQVWVADQLFATLDPTSRVALVPHLGTTVFTDTVGFIRDLPHTLVNAFKATLEESAHADLLLHVVDVSDPNHEDTRVHVLKVLDEIGASQQPALTVFNKMDRLPEAQQTLLREACFKRDDAVAVSAVTGEGIDVLRHKLHLAVRQTYVTGVLCLPSDAGAVHAWLYRQQAVSCEEPTEEGGWRLAITLPQRSWAYLKRLYPNLDHDFSPQTA